MKLQLLTLADGSPHEYTDTFVVEFDPSLHLPDGRYDGGLLRVTRDPSKARDFATMDQAIEYWRQSYGWREDGKPNRPLTAFSVQIET